MKRILIEWKIFNPNLLRIKPCICFVLIALSMFIVTIVPIFARTCDLESLVASCHKKIWQPPAANMGFCDFKDVVAFSNNQLWRPLAAKVKGHHSGLSKNMVSLVMQMQAKYELANNMLTTW